MKELRRMRLAVFLGAMAALGVGGGLALAQAPEEHAAVQATAYPVDCATMPDTSARQASQLRGCYDVDIVSAPADASAEELAAARVEALCAAIADPAERPDACSLFEAGEEDEQ